MKYGQIAGSKAINETIDYCFQFLSETETLKFVRMFNELPHDQVQIMHTFRELILGAFLSQNHYKVMYEYEIDSKTPDWCILDDNFQPQCIIELLNFHPDAETSADMIRQLQDKGIWCNFVKPNTERLYHAIWEKATKYKSLSRKYNLSYVISIFGEFTAIIDKDEINECLFGQGTGLFKMYPEMTGLLYFEESSGNYLFSFVPNPDTIKSINIPSGCLGINC
jgi:hypothetical protein